jgi:hypothetical protein
MNNVSCKMLGHGRSQAQCPTNRHFQKKIKLKKLDKPRKFLSARIITYVGLKVYNLHM